MEALVHIWSYVVASWGIMLAFIILGITITSGQEKITDCFILGVVVTAVCSVIVGAIMIFVNSIEYIARSL